MNKCVRIFSIAAILAVVPYVSQSQGVANRIRSLHDVLNDLYTDMMPLCSNLIGVGRGLAGFAATWYIGSRIWKHILNAEPIDFYPLFRPFVLGFAVLIFPSVISLINGVMNPTVTGTRQMVKDSDQAIAVLLKQKIEAVKKTTLWQMYVGPEGSGDYDKWYQYNYPGETEGWMEAIPNHLRFISDRATFNIKNAIKLWLSEVLKILFEAAGLCINTLRTFSMIILAILGPLVFGISVFDGFQHTLTVWIARYINIFLWLPVANIFGAVVGKIQENMLKVDLQQIEHNGDTFFSTADTGYLIFLIIGIVGYFTVPSVANYIIHASGGNTLLLKVTNMVSTTHRTVVHSANAATGMTMDALSGMANKVSNSMASQSSSQGYFTDGGNAGDYQKDKLKGS